MHTVTLSGTDQHFPVGKIVCLGRNYHDHIRELGNELPERAVLFMKPASSIIGNGETVVIPGYSHDCHHEVELALLIGRGGKHIAEAAARDVIAGYGVAIDLTLRDIQQELKQKGLPWDIAKGFDTACPLSDFVPAATVADAQNLQLTLSVNGIVRQDATTALMIRSIPRIIAEISAIFTLEPGDIILTGTPAGVGPVVSGDRMTATIAGVGTLDIGVR
ncbi:MAG: acylpyruvase [Desulfuromonadales bacterium GWD2_61_12]|nr:MAG: acylpyruvase [Desulfuromonadales bacterium GWC2_61_20]OGR36563.1 MAG: acylpyruvase [Desulfuromonadales bacterium GWD2_61_12]HAD05043.1 fumarylacetoacetate hydrolase family protein [Desulfuromonas sp.]HBT84001.1 fumarylacetoacetate hydrolase family protein [Desulfuromonas sp.]